MQQFEDTLGIKLNDEYCGRCSICSSICPYDAISVDSVTAEVKIDQEECQFCGICYSACPVNAIEIIYYDYDTLLKKVENRAREKKADTLVLMCRGNSPPTGDVEQILKGDYQDYIPLRVPCVGRVPPEFVLKMYSVGIRRIVAIRCEEDFCRFKEGSRINNQRLLLTREVLKELGFKEQTLQVATYARKAQYNTDECVGCDKCVFTCPYDAIEVMPFATPNIISEECVGCGSCALVCPHSAIQIEGFEHKTVSDRIQRYGKAAKQLKSKGISPLILVFSCQWSEFSALDEPRNNLLHNRAFVMEIPCFKGLDPYHVIEALYSGFDGVLAAVCSDSDCKLDKGYELGIRNEAVLRDTLSKLNLKERFDLYTLSPRSVHGFNKHVETFISKINTLPSNPGTPFKSGTKK